MIDIHSHILHEVDDGPQSIEESIELLKSMISQGITTVIATPHINKGRFDAKLENINKSYNELVSLAKDNNLHIDIKLGSELNIRGSVYEIIKSHRFNTLAGTNYILLELNDDTITDELCNTIYEIKLMGYKIIIAHVERYLSLYRNKELLKSLLDEDVYLQINTMSLLNSDKTTLEYCDYLLSNNLISFAASDTHNLTNRSCLMAAAYNLIKTKYSQAYADYIFTENPKSLLEGAEIPYCYIEVEAPKKKLLKIFRRKQAED